jgi:hypothetical protein
MEAPNWRTGLAVAMRMHPDGHANEVALVVALVGHGQRISLEGKSGLAAVRPRLPRGATPRPIDISGRARTFTLLRSCATCDRIGCLLDRTSAALASPSGRNRVTGQTTPPS